MVQTATQATTNTQINMGLLIDGKWSNQWYKPAKDGSFVRSKQTFRDKVGGSSGFKPEPNRYHLYVSYACPWASRVLIMRKLKRLEDVIELSVVHPLMFDAGWQFGDYPGAIADSVNNARYLRDVYTAADAKFTGRVTVPVFFDKRTNNIVNNESRDIIRFLETEFDAWGDASVNFCPPDLQETVDAMITANYEPINNGVYKCGFAASQEAYDRAVNELFDGLDRCEDILSRQRYLCGDRITEADWCLFVTLIRFDAVYFVHFKCSKRHIYEYENLFNYAKELYQVPGVADTVNFDHIRSHYYRSHETINPHRILPRQTLKDYNEAHDRKRFS